MEVPGWVGKVATGVALSNPVTAPVMLGKWVADKAVGALGPKTEAAPPIRPQVPTAPPSPPAVTPAQPVAEQAGEVKPNYNRNTSGQAAGNKPLVGSDGKWDGASILNGQTQASKDDPSSQKEQDHRCGPSAVLGAAVMGGKDSTASLAKNLQSHARPEDGAELQQIRARIDSGQATHKDLSRLQHIMYNAYHDPAAKDPNMSPGQLSKMQKDLADPGKIRDNSTLSDYGGNTGASFQKTNADKTAVVVSPDRLQAKAGQLQSGQSFIQQVDSTSNQQGLDHYVTVGKDKDGRTYVYDPGGKDNQPQVIYQDQRPQAFNHYTNGAMGGQDHGRPALAQTGGVVTN